MPRGDRTRRVGLRGEEAEDRVPAVPQHFETGFLEEEEEERAMGPRSGSQWGQKNVRKMWLRRSQEKNVRGPIGEAEG